MAEILPLPTRPRSRLKATDRRDQLLDALVSLIRSEGHEQVTMARLAQMAGVNPSLLMHHFGSKENLMLALVERSLERYSRLFRQMPQQGSGRSRLVQMLGLLFGQPWMDTLMAPELFAILSIARRNPDVAASVNRMYRRYHKVLTQELRLQQEEGCVRLTDPAASARVLMALVEGAHYFSEQLSPYGDDYSGQLLSHALVLLGAGPLTRSEQSLLLSLAGSPLTPDSVSTPEAAPEPTPEPDPAS
ncbi:TetR/AcrR family transcriptional regulator [Thalassolituus sp. LLYu03]|uniref:TetR/AcrR family transcriptional regulator n=1 Tax=Thalassolituus sp. LLYu03 TaxID=3421656 RepID=UPI003D2893D3